MISFTVFGKPEPAGSKKAFARGRFASVVDANEKSRPWKNLVSQTAADNFSGPLLRDAIRLTLTFYRPRPKGHFNSKGDLNKKGRDEIFPTTKPDALKLARGVEDALTGVVYADDSQIVEESLFKRYGEPARCEVVVEVIKEVGK